MGLSLKAMVLTWLPIEDDGLCKDLEDHNAYLIHLQDKFMLKFCQSVI